MTWEVCGEVEVEANSPEEAIKNFNPDDHNLPVESDYVDGSFRLTDSGPEGIEMIKAANNIK